MPDSGASAMEERFQSHELHRELVEDWAHAWPELVEIMSGLAAKEGLHSGLAMNAVIAYRQLTGVVDGEVQANRMPDGEQR